MKSFNVKEVSFFDIEYFRERQRNNIYQAVISHFAKKAEEGLTKKEVAEILKKDPAQITRWLSGPGNLTLDTISDLFLAMGAEMKHEVISLGESKTNDFLHLKLESFPRSGNNNVTTSAESFKISHANF